MSISQPPFQSTLVDANDRVQTPWAQWFSQLQPILQSVVASGPTSGRPTQNLYIGYPYFDTTIDQMVYWNGVVWVTYAPSTTGTNILKGNGSGGFNNAVAGVDYAPATSGSAILYGDGAGGFSSVSIGSGVTFAGGVLSATGSGGTVTSVTGTAPIASSGGNTPAISISQAGVSTNGYLSSTDWNTFNNKGSGTVTSVTGSGNIASSGGTTPDITFTGTLPIANGGTNGTATPTAGAVAYGTGTAYNFTSVGSTGQYLQSNGTSAPTWSSISSGLGSPAYYGLMISTNNQANGGATTANIVALDTSPVLSNGVSVVATGKITFSNDGKYHLITELSFINTVGSNPSTSIWLTQNGSIIPNSAQDIAFQGGANDVETSTCAWILDIAAGDYVQIYWFCGTTTVSLVYQGALTSPTRPASPSAIVSVFSLSQIGIGYYGLSSTTSNTIGTGNKTFTTNLSNLNTAFVVGTRIRVAYDTTPANFMEGVITSFSGTTLVVNVDSIGGSGTYANWTISVAGIQGANGVTSITGTANQVIASASTGAVTLSLPQNINSGAAPTFLGTNFTGTASLNINGTVGATTATTGKFTTITGSSDALINGTTVGLGGGANGSNIALGNNALVLNSTGVNNAAIGYYALSKNTSGQGNLAISREALFTNVTGNFNTSIGFRSLYTSVGFRNTVVGYGAASAMTSATDNICIGYISGNAITTGGGNVIIGSYTGAAAPISLTGTNYVVLSDGAGAIRTYYDASGNKVNYGVNATSAAAPTIASATTIAPTKAITFISGVTPIVTITAPSPISLGGGQITLIPTGIFTTTTAGNIALASTAVVSKALIMTYDVTTAKWYPSY